MDKSIKFKMTFINNPGLNRGLLKWINPLCKNDRHSHT